MGKVPSKAASNDMLQDTARIDRRNTVLAQIEAVLLADKLRAEQGPSARTPAGSDPYNSNVGKGTAPAGVWTQKRPR